MATLMDRLKTIEKEIQEATIESSVREKQLNELKPKRKLLEDESKEQFGVDINKLSELILQKEKSLEKMIEELEINLEDAKSGVEI